LRFYRIKTIPDYTMSVQIVFICHDEESVQTVLPYGHPILLVGDKTVTKTDKMIVVRDLLNHIEHIPKLLTFTAWYAIVKNNLFKEYDFLCLLEWDAVLEDSFESNLKALCATDVHAISFMESGLCDLLADLNTKVFFKFLNEKGFTYADVFSIQTWGISSNQCLRRSLLEEFVEWYYPCPTILQEDPKRVSWYHERIYMVYLKHHSIPYTLCKGLTHLFKNSHQKINQDNRMKIFVAHYSKLVERKNHIIEMFKREGITDYEFIENFDKESLTEELTMFSNLSLSEISLFLKHIYIYKRIIENYDEALIVEDDIVLCKDFISQLQKYKTQVPKDYDIVYLGNGCNLHVCSHAIRPSQHIYEIKDKSSKCTDSYLIQKKACVQLVDYFKKGIQLPIDWWLTETSKSKDLSIFWVEPTLVSQGSQTNLFKSSIR